MSNAPHTPSRAGARAPAPLTLVSFTHTDQRAEDDRWLGLEHDPHDVALAEQLDRDIADDRHTKDAA